VALFLAIPQPGVVCIYFPKITFFSDNLVPDTERHLSMTEDLDLHV